MDPYEIGDRVFCGQGTKSGVGIITSIEKDGAVVDFPDQPYPITMTTISGAYFIPWREIIARVPDSGTPISTQGGGSA